MNPRNGSIWHCRQCDLAFLMYCMPLADHGAYRFRPVIMHPHQEEQKKFIEIKDLPRMMKGTSRHVPAPHFRSSFDFL
jgi:hypothetical protein